MDEKVRQELLKSIYEQHWLHTRHVEAERHWFTTIIGVLVAGLLTLLGTIDIKFLPVFAVWGGCIVLLLSLLGYFFCLTLRAPLIEHTTLANKILKDSQLLDYAPYISKAYRGVKIGWLTAHELFLYFYSLMVGVGCFLIIFWGAGGGEVKSLFLWISIAVAITVSSGLCLLWRGRFRKREVEYRKEMDVHEW